MAKENLMSTGEHISKEWMRNRLAELNGKFDFYYCPITGACVVPKELMVDLLTNLSKSLINADDRKLINKILKIIESK